MYASILIYLFDISFFGNRMSESTTIRVSKKTAETLEHLREKLGAQSIDEAIQTLVKKQRRTILETTFGVDRNRIKPFTEADRGEDRD
jgi:predicted RNA binding protein with dsRBD fold (UPF0201 family)